MSETASVVISRAPKDTKDEHGNKLRRRYGTFLSATKDCACGEILAKEKPTVFVLRREGDTAFMKSVLWMLVDKILQDKIPLDKYMEARVDGILLFNYTKRNKFTDEDEEAIQKLRRLHKVSEARVKSFHNFVRAYAVEGKVKIDDVMYEHAGLFLDSGGLLGFANHCCVPNAVIKLAESNGTKEYALISTMPIAKEAQVTVAYIPFTTFKGNDKLKAKAEGDPIDFDTMIDMSIDKNIESRLADLYNKYGFACSCDYCFAILSKELPEQDDNKIPET